MPSRNFGPSTAVGQERDQAVAQAFVFGVQFVGDVLVGAVGRAQQRLGGAAEEAVGGQEEPQPLQLLRVVELGEIEQLVGVAAAAEAIEPDLDAIGNEHPAAPGRVDGVIPRLLHRARSRVPA